VKGWQHVRRAASSGLSFTSMDRDNDKQACQAVSAVLFALKARHGRYVWLAPNVGGLVVGHGSGGSSGMLSVAVPTIQGCSVIN